MNRITMRRLLTISIFFIVIFTYITSVCAASGTVHDDTGEPAVKALGWQRDGGGWRYYNQDGAMRTGWLKDNNRWYYLDEKGLMVTGWHQVAGVWYYFYSSGTMATGWLKIKNNWFYLNASGTMTTGWVKYNGKWYYMWASGVMACGWIEDGGNWYYLKGSGEMATGWVKSGGKWYYMGRNGVMARGWIKDGGRWYYLKNSGEMARGWIEDAGKWYYMRQSGAMATGWIKPDANWYYLLPNGQMLRSASAGHHAFDESGALITKYPKATRRVDPYKPMVALTFDDGPSAATGNILAQLDKYNARATFFMQGYRVSGNADTVRQVVAQGSEIASHTWDHKNLTLLSDAGIQKQLDDTSNAIYQAAGVRPILLRPPYGAVNGRVQAVAKGGYYAVVNWCVDTEDWKTQNAQTTYNRIMSQVRDGGIILCHDICPSTETAMKKVIPALIARGYQLVTVSELLTYAQNGIQPGQLYRYK